MKKLPDTELEVMQAIWNCPSPVHRVEIEDLLKEKHPMALTTLLTLLTRLSQKNFIKIEKNGRSSTYTPLISKEEYLAEQSKNFIQQVCEGKLTAFASALCDSGLTKDEIDELRILLERGNL